MRGVLEIGHRRGAGAVLVYEVFPVGLQTSRAAVANHLVRVHEIMERVVRESRTPEAPFVPQDGLEQGVIASRPCVSDTAKRGHDARRGAEIGNRMGLSLFVRAGL